MANTYDSRAIHGKELLDFGTEIAKKIRTDDEVIAASLNNLNSRLEAFENIENWGDILADSINTSEFPLIAGKPMVVVKAGTPSGTSTIPDYAGQFYVDSTNKVIYCSGGYSSVNDWVDVTNKIGTGTVGSATKPIYLNSGTPTAGSDYAGGTKVTLNGTDKGASTATIYAPTTAGTNNYVLKSNGSGAPTWVEKAPKASAADTATTATDYNTSSGTIKSGLDSKVNIANISLENQTTTLLAQVKALGTAGTHYARFYTKSDSGSANISDKPESGNRGFLCEVKCDRYVNATDYRYQLQCWIGADANPYVAMVDTASTSISWSKLNKTLSHTHGSITNDGKLGSTADLAVVTGTSGAVTTANLTTADPGAEGTTLTAIATVSQDSRGKITATKKTIQSASTSQKGVVQLNDNINSTSTTEAATANAVKKAYDKANGKQDPITFDGTYNASTNKAATVSTVTTAVSNAVNGLDATVTSSDGTNVQVKVTETDGKITAVNVTTDNTANKTHAHGNIQSGGTLQTNDVTIASGDKLVITDSSDSNKVARASISFDGSTTTKALTQKGTFEAFAKAADITNAINALDVSSVGGDGKYISAISEDNGKIAATATTMDTTPTASSTKAVTSGGIKSALDLKAPLASPALTGTPTAPTASSGTNTTQIATTAFVKNAVTTSNWYLSSRTSYDHNVNNAGNLCNFVVDYENWISLVLLYDVTDFYDGTIPSSGGGGHVMFLGTATMCRLGGNHYERSANIRAGIGWVASQVTLKTDCWDIKPMVVKNECDIVSQWTSGKYLVLGAVGTKVNMTPSNSDKVAYTVVNCSGYTKVFISAGAYTASDITSTAGRVWAFVDANDNILSESDGTTANLEVTVPTGAVKLICHCSNSEPDRASSYVAIKSSAPKYYIALKCSEISGTMGLFGRFIAQSPKTLLLTKIYNRGSYNGAILPAGWSTHVDCSYFVNASTAKTLETARTIQTNLASTSSASFNGSANITPGVTGTLAIGNGGTGQTSAEAIVNKTIQAGMATGDSDISDSTDIITSHVNGYSSTNERLYRRKAPYLWGYIKGKMSSVSGVNISGNAATATSAGKLTTARKTYTDLGTSSNTTTKDWSGDTVIPVYGTLPIGNGGTGATTAANARNNLSVYSKSEVDSMLTGRISIVTSLPATGEAGVIYFVGPTGSGSDKYEEYVWDGSAFVKVGEKSLDLSNYVNTLTTTGSGNAITAISKSGNTITATIGNVTFTQPQLGQGYGTCSTAEATAAKAVTLSSFVLKNGGIVAVKFTYALCASATLNVNSTGAKPVLIAGAAPTASTCKAVQANDIAYFIYDGTSYHFLGTERASRSSITNITRSGTTFTATRADGSTFTFTQQDNNTTYTQEKLGQGYGTCTTAEATAAKAVSLTNYELVTNGIIAVKFSYGLCASATLNVNSKGAKPIYIQGAAVTSTTAKEVLAGDIALFMYDGSQYQFLCSDRLSKDAIAGLSISGKTITYTKADGTTGTLTTQDTTYTFDGTYNASTNKAATVSTVTNKIAALDVSDISGFGAGKTLATLTETDGKIAATFQNISITKSQVSDFPTSMTPTSHTHGNIANGGTLTDTAAAAAGNDYVVIRDADNSKIQTSTIKGTDVADAVSKKHSHSTLTLSTTAQAYDGTHTLALPASDPYTSARTPTSHTHGNITNAGAIGSTSGYAVYTTTNGVLTAGTLATSDPTASGNTLSFIDTISQDAKGKITATKKSVTIDTALSSTSTNPVQNKVINTALAGKQNTLTEMTEAEVDDLLAVLT